jgi:hypothetical protein
MILCVALLFVASALLAFRARLRSTAGDLNRRKGEAQRIYAAIQRKEKGNVQRADGLMTEVNYEEPKLHTTLALTRRAIRVFLIAGLIAAIWSMSGWMVALDLAWSLAIIVIWDRIE